MTDSLWRRRKLGELDPVKVAARMSTCTVCRQTIHRGDRIAKQGAVWVHEHCAEAQAEGRI